MVKHEKVGSSPSRLDASGAFVLRTPVWPVSRFLELFSPFGQEGTTSELGALEAELSRRRTKTRLGLLAAFRSATLREAIFLASPSLAASLVRWEEDPEQVDASVELSLLRYVTRMATRPTPFGLFASYSLGAWAERTHIELAAIERCQRRSRLDMEYLAAVAAALGRSCRTSLRYWPNNSIYTIGGRLRYVEDRRQGRARSYHLVAVEANQALMATLERAKAGLSLEALADALVGGEVTRDDALGFVNALIDCRLLLSNLEPTLTGPDVLDALIDETARSPELARARAVLVSAQSSLSALDLAPAGVEARRYHAIAETLAELPVEAELKNLFQVDLQRPAQATLGPNVRRELELAVDVLRRITPPRADPLADFRRRFVARYDEREVALSEALDEESGVGYTTRGASDDDQGPLLSGLHFPARGMRAGTFTARDAVLARLLYGCWRFGRHTLELGAADLDALSASEPAELPDAFSLMACLVGASDADVSDGSFSVLVHSVSGPSGARMLGRFCGGDPALAKVVAEHLALEEALDPGAIYAEIVCQPQDRVGNVLARPLLRAYEIPYLGRSGAAPDRQIPLEDLRVRVVGDQIVLRSRSLDRRVLPRLSTAHFHSDPSNPNVYRFLAALQTQGVAGGLAWDWGAHEGAPFLPRVVVSRIVLARARFRLSKAEVEPIRKASGAQRFGLLQALRRERGLPRWVAYADEDSELVLDLESPHCVDNFAELLRLGGVLVEWLPAPDELVAGGVDGRFAHELVIPFVRVAEREAAQASQPLAPVREVAEAGRYFVPGSEWLFAKLYCGEATADQLLVELSESVVWPAMRDQLASLWFFIRYDDPEPHLRLRLRGSPQRLYSEVLPRLSAMCEAWRATGQLVRLELGTYERELERYGGARGIELAEQLFCADSDAVSAIALSYGGDAGRDARWRLALVGMHRLLDDFGLSLEARVAFTGRQRDRFAVEFQADAELRAEIKAIFRRERASLSGLLDPSSSEAAELASGLSLFDERSRRCRPIAAELARLEAQAELSCSVEELLPSYLHMFVNRIVRSAQRAHEFVLYDLLFSYYRSRAGRLRAEERAR